MKKSTLPHSGDWAEEWLPRVKHRLWEPEFLATRVWVYLKIVVLIKLGIFCISRDKPEVWSEWWPVNIWCFLCGHLCSFLTMNVEEASSVSHSEFSNSLESQGGDPKPSLSVLFVCLFAAVPKTCISVPGTRLFCVSGWPCWDVSQQQPWKWTWLLLTLQKLLSSTTQDMEFCIYSQQGATQLRNEARRYQRHRELTMSERGARALPVWSKHEKSYGLNMGSESTGGRAHCIHDTKRFEMAIHDSKIVRIEHLNIRPIQLPHLREKWFNEGEWLFKHHKTDLGLRKSAERRAGEWGGLIGVATLPPNYHSTVCKDYSMSDSPVLSPLTPYSLHALFPGQPALSSNVCLLCSGLQP